jgi:CRP-like cAMP-binding protein
MQPAALLDLLIQNGIAIQQQVYARNAYLCHAGTMATDIYYIEEGSVQVYVTEQDEEQIIRFVYAGNIIVALDAFLTGQPTSFYMQAIKKTKVHIIRKEAFMQWVYSDIAFTQLWARLMEDLVVQQMEREIDLLTTAPKTRYERVLSRSPQLFQQIPNKYIASYLRMSPETLSRLKKS